MELKRSLCRQSTDPPEAVPHLGWQKNVMLKNKTARQKPQSRAIDLFASMDRDRHAERRKGNRNCRCARGNVASSTLPESSNWLTHEPPFRVQGPVVPLIQSKGTPPFQQQVNSDD